MVISERQFDLLCGQYCLSPTQRKLVGEMLNGRVEDRDLVPVVGIRPTTMQVHFYRIFNKMHLRSRAAILYTFVAEAKSISP